VGYCRQRFDDTAGLVLGGNFKRRRDPTGLIYEHFKCIRRLLASHTGRSLPHDSGFVVCNVRKRGTEEIDVIHAKLRDSRYLWRLEDISGIENPILLALGTSRSS